MLLIPLAKYNRMFGPSFICLIVFMCSCCGAARSQSTVMPRETPPSFPTVRTVETHRIRVTNAVDGAVEVSTDSGDTWKTVGTVTAPATDSLMGYLASGYAKPSTVCATAIHGIRIRVGDLTSAYPKLINILPLEFSQTPHRFGGHISGLSGIYTDIHVGTSIFRDLAPHAGDRVYLQDHSGGLSPIPLNFRPKENDVVVIIVKSPVIPLTEVDFENVLGGAVTVHYVNGVTQAITTVLKPVFGIGRFDGTSYTGVGALNTCHTGVITVSTAPITTSKLFEGDGPERRGGFQIEPAFHNSQSDEAGAPMILVIGRPDKRHVPDLEGTPPLFDRYLDLDWNPDDMSHSWDVEIARDPSPHHWLPMPELIGDVSNALSGVTAIRIIRKTTPDIAWIKSELSDATASYQMAQLYAAKQRKTPVERGRVTVNAAVTPSTKFVTFFVDGQFVGMTNSAPFNMIYDTSEHADGECTVEARSTDGNGTELATARTKFYIDNHHKVSNT